MIEGVSVRSIEVHVDQRGSFAEIYSDRWGLPIQPRQWAVVRSAAGTLRGMHLHLRHDEYLLPISGRCSIGLFDLRPQSATAGKSMLIEVNADEPKCIAFPSGLVHGWYFPVDTVHIQAVSEPYDEYYADDNFGCHYADPALGIDWPATPTIISARARSFADLQSLRLHLQSIPQP